MQPVAKPNRGSSAVHRALPTGWVAEPSAAGSCYGNGDERTEYGRSRETTRDQHPPRSAGGPRGAQLPVPATMSSRPDRLSRLTVVAREMGARKFDPRTDRSQLTTVHYRTPDYLADRQQIYRFAQPRQGSMAQWLFDLGLTGLRPSPTSCSSEQGCWAHSPTRTPAERTAGGVSSLAYEPPKRLGAREGDDDRSPMCR